MLPEDTHSAEKDVNCAHRFARYGKAKVQGYWLRKPWWKCVECGFETRTYDGIDRQMTRPIHPHMTVAVPGFNTVIPAAKGGAA